ncbi:hypothetical protein [Steroidobacter cummioxidans]|uniref:hypothetical protein n=1 Tax=Steroidobacter cummioxidans TaxID=1803913 RepID=UPI000E3163E2|nr:hypothetical protein [Steroidobacter cummioxidans]
MDAMKQSLLAVAAVFAVLPANAKDPKYPPVDAYLMSRAKEIAFARSAAPASIADRATIKVLTRSGYEVASQGDNGFVCIVMRGWSAVAFTPGDARKQAYNTSLQAPICYDPVGSRTILLVEEMRAQLGLQGMTPDEIPRELAMAYALGKLPKMEGVSFAYMWSAGQNVGDDGRWHPHMMIYAPYYKSAMLGGFRPDSGLPAVAADDGTPFALVVVAVDDKLAVEPKLPGE